MTNYKCVEITCGKIDRAILETWNEKFENKFNELKREWETKLPQVIRKVDYCCQKAQIVFVSKIQSINFESC